VLAVIPQKNSGLRAFSEFAWYWEDSRQMALPQRKGHSGVAAYDTAILEMLWSIHHCNSGAGPGLLVPMPWKRKALAGPGVSRPAGW
jgi:hypothetical protein